MVDIKRGHRGRKINQILIFLINTYVAILPRYVYDGDENGISLPWDFSPRLTTPVKRPRAVRWAAHKDHGRPRAWKWYLAPRGFFTQVYNRGIDDEKIMRKMRKMKKKLIILIIFSWEENEKLIKLN